MTRRALQFTWDTLRGTWPVLLGLVVLLYWPVDLLQLYVERRWLDPDNLRASFQLARFANQFLLIIPDAAFCFVALSWLTGRRAALGSSLGAGFANYGRMWVTRFVLGLSCLSLLLLVVPGLYWLSRWSLAEVYAVADRRIGTEALGCSWRATRGLGWRVLGAWALGSLVLLGCVVVPVGALLALSLAVPDSWWLDALSSFAMSLCMPLWSLYAVGLFAQVDEKAPA